MKLKLERDENAEFIQTVRNESNQHLVGYKEEKDSLRADFSMGKGEGVYRLTFNYLPAIGANQRRACSLERFSIIRETWHLDPLRRRLLRSHFLDALSSLISVKVESELHRGETSRRIRTRPERPISRALFFPRQRYVRCLRKNNYHPRPVP